MLNILQSLSLPLPPALFLMHLAGLEEVHLNFIVAHGLLQTDLQLYPAIISVLAKVYLLIPNASHFASGPLLSCPPIPGFTILLLHPRPPLPQLATFQLLAPPLLSFNFHLVCSSKQTLMRFHKEHTSSN